MIYLLFTCCTSKDEQKPEEFLRKFFLEEGGIYTLLGDKPITDLLIYTGTEKEICLEGLSAESLRKLEYIEDHTVEMWQKWKQFSKQLKFRDYRFIERPCLGDPLYTMYLFVNLEQLKDLLQKHKEVFCAEIGRDFDIETIMNELENPISFFWNEVFANHCLSGLVHGYGERNCRYFLQMIQEGTRPIFSDQFEGPVTQENFPIPIFAMSDDSMVKKYQQQREAIQQIYKNEDFFRKTLSLLQQ